MTVATAPAARKASRYTVRLEGRVVGQGELRRVSVHIIKKDHDYQRDTSSPWIAAHLPFDSQKAGAVILSSRAGGPWCVDGGHRVELAKQSGSETINAFVVDGLTKVDEARLFSFYQRERRNLTSHALYRADLVAMDDETVAITRIVRNAGFRLDRKGGQNVITAIDGVKWVHRYGGDDLLARTLQFIGGLWIGEEKALSGQIIKGLAIFLASAGQQAQFSRDTLERVMRENGPMKVLRLSQAIAAKRAVTTTNSATNVAEALHSEYNKSVRKGSDPLQPLTISGRKRAAPRSS